MGIEVVHDQPDAFRCGEVLIDQQPHLLGKILLRPPLRDVDLTPTLQGLHEQKQIGGTFTFIFRIITSRLAWTRR